MPQLGALSPVGFEFLGSLRMPAAGVSTGVLQIPPRERLMILCNIAGYSGNDIASLRFNGDAGANYNWRYITTAAVPATQGAAQQMNAAWSAAAATLLQLAGVGVTQGRTVTVDVMNILNIPKACAVTDYTFSGVAATPGSLIYGGGEWVNTTAQITSVEMRTAGGSITMPAGTSIACFGLNP